MRKIRNGLIAVIWGIIMIADIINWYNGIPLNYFANTCACGLLWFVFLCFVFADEGDE